MTKIYKVLFPIGLFAILFLSSCELYNPAEPIPAYIHIQKIDLTTTAGQGTNSNKITDAWVYIDDQLLGCYELPVTFPVLLEGSHSIKISAGIKVNGIAANRGQYPFYTKYTQTIDLEAGKTLTLSPTVTYTTGTNFYVMQDFETPGVTIDTTPGSQTDLQIITLPDPNVFEGSYSAKAYVNNTYTFFECATVANCTLPKMGAPVFLEFNYKCNYQFTVSMTAYGSASQEQFPVLHLNPSPDWNKAYIYLTPTVSGANTANYYKVLWGMVDNIGIDSGYVVLDNIKLVY